MSFISASLPSSPGEVKCSEGNSGVKMRGWRKQNRRAEARKLFAGCGAGALGRRQSGEGNNTKRLETGYRAALGHTAEAAAAVSSVQRQAGGGGKYASEITKVPA